MRLCLILLFCLNASVKAEEFIEYVGGAGGVNWSSAQIESEGVGVGPDNAPPSTARMMACRAAVLDGQRNLLESIQGVRVEGTTVVANMMVESDTIRTSVNGVIKGARIVDRAPQADGSCVVKMTAPLAGQLVKDVYQEVLNDEQAGFWQTASDRLLAVLSDGLNLLVPEVRAADATPAPWQEGLDLLAVRLSRLEELISSHPAMVEKSDAGPTGLVIDARGSNFIPSMSPKVRQVRSGILYPDSQHQAAIRDRGQLVSLFTRDLDTARRHPAVGERPIVLKALRTFGETRTEIVLGTESSERLIALINKGFLKDSGVIIVL